MVALGGKEQVEEIYARGIAPEIIPDPGNGGTFEVSRSGYCEVTSVGAAETRTLPDPTFRGQQIDFVFVSDLGDVAVTGASAMNQTGNTIFTFTDVGEFIRLVGAYNATDGWEWKTVVTDGAAQSGP